jgi:hypothetical protein
MQNATLGASTRRWTGLVAVCVQTLCEAEVYHAKGSEDHKQDEGQ